MFWRGPSGTKREYQNIELGRTDRRTVLSLTQPYNARYAAKSLERTDALFVTRIFYAIKLV
jgi:hypothetical protein